MNSMFKILLLAGIAIYPCAISGQISDNYQDSLYIKQIQDHKNPDKVLHAEPIYIDLIRDLGARKGEHEWNVGFGLTDNLRFDSYETLIEYEWAPIDRLGLEFELPFTFYAPINDTGKDSIPPHQLNGIKMAAQWTFYVNEGKATSCALGYINELKLASFNYLTYPWIVGNVYNPFLVAAKRWGSNFHSLLYTGPKFVQTFGTNLLNHSFEVNTSFHYMISGTKNFIGVEFNKSIRGANFDMTIRPQMRLGIADNLLVGIIAGIPVSRDNERLSSFIRLIWEPGHKIGNFK